MLHLLDKKSRFQSINEKTFLLNVQGKAEKTSPCFGFRDEIFWGKSEK